MTSWSRDHLRGQKEGELQENGDHRSLLQIEIRKVAESKLFLPCLLLGTHSTLS